MSVSRAEFKMPEDFLLKVSTLGERADEIVPRVLAAGGEVMLARVRGNLLTVIGRGTKHESRSTGTLARALGVSGAKLDRNGNHNVKVGFAEPRRAVARKRKGYANYVSNAMIANVLEYGKHGQQPKPFLKTAKTAAKNACIEVMKAKLEEEIEKM